MKLHILGIAGTFMGGVAALARELGHEVEGSDQNIYPPMSTQLERLGIALRAGYTPGNISADCDEIVVGNALSRGNEAVEHVLDAGLAYTSGAQWLSERLLPGRDVLAVAGTHGKTTTTTVLAYLLEAAGRAPGFLIGGVAEDFGVSARVGGGREFVVEADEYDTAFFDKRSKFVHYKPRTLVLNNLEYDHADIFPDVAAIRRQFHHVVRIVPAIGRVIFNGTDPEIAEALAMGCWSGREAFGVEQGWHLTTDGRVDFGGERFGVLELAMPGQHNRLNALAAIAAARHVGISPAQSVAALTSFKGVKRRMELRGEVGGVKVYDDFAHHPTAIAATITALKRAARPDERILAVFEPRSNTMKLGAMRARLSSCFDDAARAYSFSGGVNWDVAEAMRPLGARAADYRNLDELVRAVACDARPGDHILVMSNGGFGGIHDKLLKQLQLSLHALA